jgi:predicted deacylase
LKSIKQPKAQKTEELSAEKTANSKAINRSILYSVFVIIACLSAGGDFLDHWQPEAVIPSSSLSKRLKLSDYLPSLRGTRGNTEVLLFEGNKTGGSVLVLGGTHPNEPASNVTATLLAENINITQGRMFVIPRANASGFTATEPQEGYPQQFTLKTRNGRNRVFRVGSRYTNMLDGWPDPIVYRHYPSGQLLSGAETRNLNRAYPGSEQGTLTERIAFAITKLVKDEKIDMVIDLHEAAPEYPVINALVAHQRAIDLAAMVTVELQMSDIDIQLEVSPENFHGLIHREIGDFTDAKVMLLETAGALQGRLRGKTNADIITIGKDPLYYKANQLGKLAVDFPEEGISIDTRVGRHIKSIKIICLTLSEFEPENTITYSNVPDYGEIIDKGVGFFLR